MSSLLDALACKNENKAPPVWLMRQAGRYLPEYRKLREKHSFLELCHKPELATEVTLLPFKRFSFDAAILFSDILVIPEALGMELSFCDNRGPVFAKPLSESKLPKIEISEKLSFIPPAIQMIKREFSKPLLGFSGAPFTLASYMIEGGTSKNLKKTKQWMLKDPEGFHQLLAQLTTLIIDYLKLQVKAGVDALQVFDSWAHVLSDHHFRQFCLPYLKKITEEVPEAPLILFCRGSSLFAPLLAEAGPAAISIDWQGDIAAIRSFVPKHIALQGNLDPDLLYASPSVIKEQVQKMIKSMEKDPGYIFNLGHGIQPDTPLDSVSALLDAVRS